MPHKACGRVKDAMSRASCSACQVLDSVHFSCDDFPSKHHGISWEAFAVIFWAQFSKGQGSAVTVWDNSASTDKFKWAARIDSHLIVSLLASLQRGYEVIGTEKQCSLLRNTV